MDSIKSQDESQLKSNHARILDNEINKNTLQSSNEKKNTSPKTKNRIEFLERRLKHLDNIYNQKNQIIKKLFE